MTSKNIYKYFEYDPDSLGLSNITNEQTKVDLKIVEGIFIEAYRRYYGIIPPWNKISGSTRGQKMLQKEIMNLLDY